MESKINFCRLATIKDYVKIFLVSESAAERYHREDSKRTLNRKVTIRNVASIWQLLDDDIIQALQ